MTVSSIIPVNNYTGNSSAKTFDFDFLIESQEELQVVLTNSNGIQTTLEFGVDYSINEIGNKNGSYITFPLEGSNFEVLSNEEIISLSLTLPIKQESEFENSANLNLNILERTFDYIVRILQIMNRKIERSVKTQEGSSITPDEIIDDLQKSAQNSKLYAEISSQKSQEAQNSANEALQSETGVQNVKEEIIELSENVKNDIATGINNYKALGMYLKNGVLYYKKETGEVVPYVVGTQMPVGSLVQLACGKNYVPDGCLPCDGAEYSKSQFPDLWGNYLSGIIETTEKWTAPIKIHSDSAYGMHAITYGNGKFVAVGSAGYSSTSTDGETWTIPVQAISRILYGVTYGNGKFVAVGYEGYTTTSTDGKAWTNFVQVGSATWNSITYGNGKFVVVGENGYIATSTNGEIWTTPVQVGSTTWNSIAYGNGKFVAVGENGYSSTSTDGEIWTEPVAEDCRGNGIAYGNGKFVAVSGTGSAKISTDGETWIFSTIGADLRKITYSNGKFVAVGYNGYISTSPDGEIWTEPIQVAEGEYLNDIAYGNGKFVAVSSSGSAITSEKESLLNTCTYEDYATEVETYGQCGKFAVDSENEKFKVPLIKDGAIIQQALSDSELGKSYNAGLPNITGEMEITSAKSIAYNAYLSGAFALGENLGKQTGYGNASSDYQQYRLAIDASGSNTIYGNSDTVQPNAVALRYFVVVANGQINESMMDWSAWASGLQSKLNKDHSNDEKPYVTEVSDRSLLPSWYRIWSDGWCEQGGLVTGGSSASGDSVTFLKPFANDNISLSAQVIGSSTPTNAAVTYVKTTSLSSTGFLNATGYVGASSAVFSAYKFSWEAKGYIE